MFGMDSIRPTTNEAAGKAIDNSDDENEGNLDVPVRKPKRSLPRDPTKWPLEVQTTVLTGVLQHKPVGINASFRMSALLDFVCSSPPTVVDAGARDQSQRHLDESVQDFDITTDDLWNFLKTYYDLTALDQTEPLHLNFGNGKRGRIDDGVESEMAISDFSLPEAEFGHLMQAKMEQAAKSSSNIPIAPESPPPAKQRKTKGKISSVKSTEDAESVCSSRSSTPASGGNATGTSGTSSVPATRRSRQRKD